MSPPSPRATAQPRPRKAAERATARPAPAAVKPPVAAAHAAAAIAPGDQVRLLFSPGSAILTRSAADEMSRIAETMRGDDSLRIQLMAYAGDSTESPSQARRLSLSRALAARSYLIGQGVLSTRIDVRALGNRSSGGPPDRVDIVVARR